MKIIGHRGARGIELENSLTSIRAAMRLAVDALELDIHRTQDGQLVVIHDKTTGRVAEQNVRIADTTLQELKSIPLKNGQTIPNLEEVLSVAEDQELYIDIKDEGCAQELLRLLGQHPKVRASFVSHHVSELAKIRQLEPNAHTYIYFLKAKNILPRPIKWVRTAQSIRATGIGLDKLFLNPVTYRLAIRAGLKVYVYSVSTAWFAHLILRLFPKVDIATGHPERLNKLKHP